MTSPHASGLQSPPVDRLPGGRWAVPWDHAPRLHPAIGPCARSLHQLSVASPDIVYHSALSAPVVNVPGFPNLNSTFLLAGGVEEPKTCFLDSCVWQCSRCALQAVGDLEAQASKRSLSASQHCSEAHGCSLCGRHEQNSYHGNNEYIFGEGSSMAGSN